MRLLRQVCLTFTKCAYYSHENVLITSIIHYLKFKDFNNDSFIKDFETLLTQSFNEEAVPF